MLEQEEIDYLEKTLESLRHAHTNLSDDVHLQMSTTKIYKNI